MGAPKAPKPPDPRETAAAQTATNVSTATANALLSNVNQYGPDGNIIYNQTGTQEIYDPTADTTYEVPIWEQRTELSPENQQLYDIGKQTDIGLAQIGQRQTDRIGNLLSTNVNFDGLTERGDPSMLRDPNTDLVNYASTRAAGMAGQGIQTSVNGLNFGGVPDYAGPIDARNGTAQRDLGYAGAIRSSYGDPQGYEGARKDVEDALLSRINPDLERDAQAARSRAAAQGIDLGSRAYSRLEEDLGRNANDARYGAILAGGQEQSRLDDLEYRRTAFGNQAQQQRFNQELQRGAFRNEAINQDFARDMQLGAANAQLANERARGLEGRRIAEADFGLAQGQFANNAQDQQFGQILGLGQFGQQIGDQQFNRDLARLNAQNATRDAEINETLTQRNQPLNEIAALLSGTAVQQPQFQSVQTAQLPTVDYGQLVNQNYQQELQRSQQRSGLFGSILGLGGTLGGAYLGTL